MILALILVMTPHYGPVWEHGTIRYPGVWQVPGSANVWTDGVDAWSGNPACKELGFLLQPGSPAIDYVEPDVPQIPPEMDLSCPAPGLNRTGCIEWWGNAPDAGACEYWPISAVLDGVPGAPSRVIANVQ